MSIDNIEFYDNGGKTIDRITIVFLNVKQVGARDFTTYACIGSSETGEEFFQHGYCTLGPHLGKKIEFKDLHPQLQDKLLNYFKD